MKVTKGALVALGMSGVAFGALAAPESPDPANTVAPAPASAAAEPPDASPLPTIPVATVASAEPTPAVERKNQVTLDEVVVTATKREANLRSLPSSIAALRGEDIERLGYQSQEDFLKLVPGVTFSNDNITPSRITVRGIGADLNTSNTTGVFIGDVPFEDPTLPRVTLDPNPFDLARIEVLKGPQGTLFGGSALNGAVRYVPQNAKLETWEAKAYGQIEAIHEGSLGQSYGAAVNVPAGDRLAFRLMGFDRRAGGFVDDRQRDLDDVNTSQQQGGRLMALWRPGEAWQITGMAVLQNTQVDDSAITDNRDGELSRSNTPKASPSDAHYDLQSLGVQYSFARFDLLSQTSRTYKTFQAVADASRIGNTGDNPLDTVTITNDNESEGLMQEFRITSNQGSPSWWNWLGGVFWRRVQMTEVSDILASNRALPIPPALLDTLGGLIPGLGGVITEDGRINTARGAADPVDVTEMALFGETTLTFFDDLDLTLGARAFRTVSDSVVRFSGVLVTDPRNPNIGLERVNAGRLQEQGVNPRVALKYTFNENVAAYTSVSRGFRFGGAQVLVGTLTSDAPEFYKSDTLWSYEAGLRTQWFNRKLLFDVTPFQIDWKDPQLQQSDASGLGAYFDNVGGSQARGVELAMRYRTPLPGLSLAFNGSYVRNVTTKPFTTSSGVDTEPGTRWPLAAEYQTATTLSYKRALAAGWTSNSSLLYTTISEAPNTLAYLDTVFGYETMDANLSLSNTTLAGQPELSLTLANATDERGIISGSNNPNFASDHVYIRPRTLIVRVGFSF